MSIPDDGETISRMEPTILSDEAQRKHGLVDRAFEVVAQSSSLAASLPASIVAPLRDTVRAMNCYYSNLIEGHDTHPVEIERAMKADFSADKAMRDLQLEAAAHIAVQAWLDDGTGPFTTVAMIRDIHRRFCEALPTELLVATDPTTGTSHRVVAGVYRDHYVQVGRHYPVSPGAIPRFMDRFETVYGSLGKTDSIVASAAAHHRLAWIHPFTDGNGRVTRLLSHAVLSEKTGARSLWSISRGLARKKDDYLGHMAACDMVRRNDLDGRGHLSEEALAAFTAFFLDVCLDQIGFMAALFRPRDLADRIGRWAQDQIRAKILPERSDVVLTQLLVLGAIPRSDIAGLLGVSERTVTRIVAALLDQGAITADRRGPIRLTFSPKLGAHWMPNLFP